MLGSMEQTNPFLNNFLSSLLVIVFLATVPPFFVLAQVNITLGSSLAPDSATKSWLSPSGDFAFGFRPLDSDPTLFLLAIWFDKTTDKTVVWNANVQTGSKLELTTDGKLLLSDQTGKVVWDVSRQDVAYASMKDDGNFVLSSSNGSTIWDSFSVPTDTILPGQELAKGSSLRCKLTDNDFSGGRFMLQLFTNGSLMFCIVAVPTGNMYGSYTNYTNNNGTKLVFNPDAVELPWIDGGTTTIVSSGGDNNYPQRATLDPDGVLRYYVYGKDGTSSWTAIDAVPKNICGNLLGIGSGICGFNSLCSSQETIERLDCECPPKFSFIDSERKYKGCKPDFILPSCDSNSSEYEMTRENDFDWPLLAYEHYERVSLDNCSKECLNDCFCMVVIYKDGNCWKKRWPLSNGIKGSVADRSAYIKYPKNINRDIKGRKPWILVGSFLLGSSFFLNLLLAVILITISCSIRRNRRMFRTKNKERSTSKLLAFTYKELEEATHDFSEELGRGACGIVYKGYLQSYYKLCIAVKKLDRLDDSEKEFANEVQSIGQTCHKNLVRLLGFCNEGNQRLLVYEFMSNGSLTNYLFKGEKPLWNQRVEIAMGIAKGLVYLHEGLDTPIIHCDIKPENILLDDNFVARISDFGLAKLLKTHQSRTNTGIRGTRGYIAPEWFRNVGISRMVDVYSFGVMLLEIICCRKNVKKDNEDDEQMILTYWAYDCYREQRLDLLVKDDEELLLDTKSLERFVKVAIWCIQEDPILRPSMNQVIQMLQGAISVAPPPDPSGDSVPIF